MVEVVNNDESNEFGKQEKPHVITVASSIFLRMLALVILAVSIVFWSQVLGFQGSDIKQIYISNEFRGVLLAVLAVVTPLLGVGLWLGMSWARILWGLLSAALVTLYLVGQPISSEMLIFGASLMILLVFYYFAQLCHLYIRHRKRNTVVNISK